MYRKNYVIHENSLNKLLLLSSLQTRKSLQNYIFFQPSRLENQGISFTLSLQIREYKKFRDVGARILRLKKTRDIRTWIRGYEEIVNDETCSKGMSVWNVYEDSSLLGTRRSYSGFFWKKKFKNIYSKISIK